MIFENPKKQRRRSALTLLLVNIAAKIPGRFLNLFALSVFFNVLLLKTLLLNCDWLAVSGSIFDKSSNLMSPGGVKPD